MTRQTISNILAGVGGIMMLTSLVFLHDDQVGLASLLVTLGVILVAVSFFLD